MKTLSEAVIEMDNDGGGWRKVEFYTKSSTSDIFDALKTLNGIANVAIYAPEINGKWLTIEQSAREMAQDFKNMLEEMERELES